VPLFVFSFVTDGMCVSERQVFREKLGEVLAEKMLYIVEAMSRHEYVPKIPNQTELDLVFDISLPDVQPYLFKVTCYQFLVVTVLVLIVY